MQSQSPSEDIRRYFAILWRWAWLIILASFLAGISALVVSLRMDPIYQASTTLLVNEAPGTQATDYTALLASERLTRTYSEMLVKKPVLNEVIEHMNLPFTNEALKEMITVQAVRDTQLIEIIVEDTLPNRAASIANEIVVVFSDQIQAMQEARYASTKISLEVQLNKLETEIDEAQTAILSLGEAADEKTERDRLEATIVGYRQTYASILQSYEQVRLSEAETISNVIQAERADPSLEPIRPRVFINTALASVVGAMLALGGVFLMESLDDTIRGTEDVTGYLELPVLGVIRKIESGENLVTAVNPRAPASEDFRSLRTNIQFASVDLPLRTILVTSATPGDGKTTISSNVSVVLAQGGKTVAFIDADLRRPRVHKQMRISNRWGLTSLFMDDGVNFNSVMRKNESSGLSIVTSGKIPPNPAELLGSEKMEKIITALKSQVDMVVFDSPPLTAVTDAAVLSKKVDGVILVVESGKTKITAAQHAVKQLQRVGANILGVVINNVGANNHRYYFNYYYKYYTSDYPTDYSAQYQTFRQRKKTSKRLRKTKKQ